MALFASEGRPLAERLRPQRLEDFAGQEHLLGEGAPLRRMLETGDPANLILWGPPGSGKSTLAALLAKHARAQRMRIHASEEGAEALRRAVERGRTLRRTGGQLVVIVEEIQHLHRGQQELLLRALEEGDLTLLATTTQNPFYALVPPLVSRCLVFQLEPLSEEALSRILTRAMKDPALQDLQVPEEGKRALLRAAQGDARRLLNILERIAGSGETLVQPEVVERFAGVLPVYFGRDQLYDVISAFIKSVRGSDPDAALYWLAHLLRAGVDPRYIARRIVILASEDIGLADPQALPLAVSSAQALEMLGLPEGALALAEATLYLAMAPKSNSVLQALSRARRAAERPPEVPAHLKDAHHPRAREWGATGYRYPHEAPKHFIPQVYHPGERFYEPGDQGYELRLRAFLRWLRGEI